MEDEDNETAVRITYVQPRLHDRWSLLAFASSALAEFAQAFSNVTEVGSMMAVEHAAQKRYDRKFREITR